MSALAEALEALRDALGAVDVGWYVFGAQAVAVHGTPRATQDVDVTAAAEPGRWGALRAELRARGFEDRNPDLARELLTSGRVLLLRHTGGMDVDLVLAGPGLEQQFLERAVEASLDGVQVPVASPTDLIVMKVLSGRGKDIDDALAIACTSDIDAELARDLLGQLEAALGQSDLLPMLERILLG